MAGATRLYIASDLHAAEKAWRKFVNAIRLNVYKADVALLAGDLTGKAIVPILHDNDRYQTDLFGVHRTARSEQELAQLQRDIADVGYYSFVTDSITPRGRPRARSPRTSSTLASTRSPGRCATLAARCS